MFEELVNLLKQKEQQSKIRTRNGKKKKQKKNPKGNKRS